MASRNVKNFELKLSKLGLLLFTGGMAVLIFAVFLFGVKVGENIDTYPEKYSRNIPDMIRGCFSRTDGGQRTASREQPAGSLAAKQANEFGLTFYDTLSKKRTGINNSPALDIGEGKQAGESAKILVPSAGPPSEKKALEINRQPVTLLPPTGGTPPQAGTPAPPQAMERYLIQVASYRERGKAEELCKKIKVLGYTPRLMMINLRNRGKWFRVTVAGIEGKQQAEKVAELLTGKVGAVNCIVRRANGKGN